MPATASSGVAQYLGLSIESDTGSASASVPQAQSVKSIGYVYRPIRVHNMHAPVPVPNARHTNDRDLLAPVPLEVGLVHALDVARDVRLVERRRRVPAPLLVLVRQRQVVGGRRCQWSKRAACRLGCGGRSAREHERPAAPAAEHPRWIGWIPVQRT